MPNFQAFICWLFYWLLMLYVTITTYLKIIPVPELIQKLMWQLFAAMMSWAMSWVGCLLKKSELCRKLATSSKNLWYSHSLNFHVSGSTKSVCKQPTQLIVELNSSLWHIIVATNTCQLILCNRMYLCKTVSNLLN